MADYIERFADNGRRIRFPKDLPRAKQDEFLAQYGRDTGEKSVSQDQPMQNLAKMSGLPEGTIIPKDPRIEQIMSGQPQVATQAQPRSMPQAPRGALPFQNEPEYAKYISRPGRPSKGKGFNPLDYEESAETFGRNEAEKRGASRIGPEIMASMMLGPAFGGTATGLGGAALRTLGNMATQGGVAAAFNPEDLVRQGGQAAGITGVMHPITELIGSNNKYARMAKRALAPLLSSGLGYVAAEETGIPWWLKPLAPVAGYKAGSKLYSKLASKDALMMPAAEKILERMTPEAEKKYLLAKKLGIDLMPDEVTGDVALQAIRNQAGHTEEGANLFKQFQESREGAVNSRFKDFLKKIYDPEKLDAPRRAGYADVSSSMVKPEDMTGIYEKPNLKLTGETKSKPRFQLAGETKTGKPIIKPLESKTTKQGNISSEAQDVVDQYSKAIKGERKAIDPVIQESIDRMMKNSAYKKKFKNIPKEDLPYSGEFIDGLKKHIGEKAKRLEARGYGTEAFEQKDSLAKFLKQVDPLLSKYKQTRYFHELFKTRGDIAKLVQKGERPNQSLSTYLKDSEKKKDLIRSLRGVKDGRQYVKDIDDVFKLIQDIDVNSLHKNLPRQLGSAEQNTLKDLLKSLMNSFKSGEFDKATVELITSKDWLNKSRELAKVTNREAKAQKVLGYISKIATKSPKLNEAKPRKEEMLDIRIPYNLDEGEGAE